MSGAIAIPSSLSMLGAYNVRTYGTAADGTTDDTAAIQAALNAAESTGSPVICPPGVYLIAGQLTIPQSVQFMGSWRTGSNPTFEWGGGNVWSPTNQGGTTLLITGGAGNPSGTAAITLANAASIEGMCLYWPNQVAVTASTPTTYPWAITTQGCNAIRNMMLLNPYQGIQCAAARNFIDQVYGNPLGIGIQVSGCVDSQRIHNCHFWPYWVPWNPGKGGLTDWILAYGTGYSFGRMDEFLASGLFAFGYNTGYHFYNDQSNPNLTGPSYGTLIDCCTDQCTYAIKCDECTAFQGVNWIGGGFAAGNVTMTLGKFNLTNVRFWNTGPNTITHTGGTLKINGCNFGRTINITSSGSAFTFLNNTLDYASSTIQLSGSGKATIVGNTLQDTSNPSATFASIISGTMSGGTVIGNNN